MHHNGGANATNQLRLGGFFRIKIGGNKKRHAGIIIQDGAFSNSTMITKNTAAVLS